MDDGQTEPWNGPEGPDGEKATIFRAGSAIF
jgi:hypothetical protein